MLSKCTRIALTALSCSAFFSLPVNAHQEENTEVAINRTEQMQSSQRGYVPFKEVDRGPRRDITDVYAVPLDEDEADEDLEIENLEERSTSR